MLVPAICRWRMTGSRWSYHLQSPVQHCGCQLPCHTQSTSLTGEDLTQYISAESITGILEWDQQSGAELNLTVPVNWTAIPPQAEYRLGLTFGAAWNAVLSGRPQRDSCAHLWCPARSVPARNIQVGAAAVCASSSSLPGDDPSVSGDVAECLSKTCLLAATTCSRVISLQMLTRRIVLQSRIYLCRALSSRCAAKGLGCQYAVLYDWQEHTAPLRISMLVSCSDGHA